MRKKFEFRSTIVILILILSIIEFVDVVTAEDLKKCEDLQTPNEKSSYSLESLIEKDLNSTENTSNNLKSRRKRYVAFPEGSSFSVKYY